MNTEVDDIAFAGGHVGSKRNPDNKVSFSRVAGLSHWSPGALPDGVGQTIRETVFWSPPELTAPDESDHINSSLCHGFIFDFCGVEIDRTTLQTRIDRYVTMHDCGTILHPAMVDGQIRGGFAQAVGAALYEEYAYAADGSFLTGTFADYLLPTTAEVPDPVILHMETPSPFTPLGSKGVGEGNCMSTPVCIANAVADALGCNGPRVAAGAGETRAHRARCRTARRRRVAPPRRSRSAAATGDCAAKARRRSARRPSGSGPCCSIPTTLQAVIPGCHSVQKISDTHFRADVTIGIGPVKGRYRADVKLSDLDPPRAVTLGGAAEGALGFGSGEGRITLVPIAERRHDDPLRLRGGDRRQGGEHRRPPARRRRARDHRSVLCGAGAQGRRRRIRCDPQSSPFAKMRRLFGGQSMKPAAFDYVRAEHLDEALDVLGREGGDARIMAGGQSLMAMLNMRLAKPKTLIDIMRLPELRRIERKAERITIGAGVRQAALLEWPELGQSLRLVALALPWTGHVQTRSRGTVCGSIAHADPSAELPLVLRALGGEVHLRSAKRRRRVAAKDFFAGMMATTRADEELIEAVSFPAVRKRLRLS